MDHGSSEDCSKPVHEYREKRHRVAENHDSRFQLRVCKAQNTFLKQRHWLARQNFENFRPFHLDVFQHVWDDTLAIQGCVTQSSCGRSCCDIADHSPASLCFLILDVTKRWSKWWDSRICQKDHELAKGMRHLAKWSCRMDCHWADTLLMLILGRDTTRPNFGILVNEIDSVIDVLPVLLGLHCPGELRLLKPAYYADDPLPTTHWSNVEMPLAC